MPILYIFRGPPATGKSTRRAEMVAADPALGYVNKDELREQFPSDTEREIHLRQFLALDSFARAGRDIIIDNTNLNTRTVDSYLSWAKKYQYQTETISFGHDMPYEEAVRRDLARGQRGGRYVGPSVIWQFYVDAGLLPAREAKDRPDLILFDVDGTAADIAHRRHHVRGDQKDWKAFNAGMAQDSVNTPVWLAYMAHRGQTRVAFMSGRGAESRAVTERWLEDNDYWGYVFLLMRGYHDSRPDHVIKRELYEKYVQPYYNVRIVYDDRPSVIRTWRSLGLSVFDVGDGVEF